jgi:hypothetical protein
VSLLSAELPEPPEAELSELPPQADRVSATVLAAMRVPKVRVVVARDFIVRSVLSMCAVSDW